MQHPPQVSLLACLLILHLPARFSEPDREVLHDTFLLTTTITDLLLTTDLMMLSFILNADVVKCIAKITSSGEKHTSDNSNAISLETPQSIK